MCFFKQLKSYNIFYNHVRLEMLAPCAPALHWANGSLLCKAVVLLNLVAYWCSLYHQSSFLKLVYMLNMCKQKRYIVSKPPIPSFWKSCSQRIGFTLIIHVKNVKHEWLLCSSFLFSGHTCWTMGERKQEDSGPNRDVRRGK